MKQVLSDQLRRDLRKLLDEIEHAGEHVVVGRWDKPVAVLVPVDWYEQAKSALAASSTRTRQGGQVIHKDGDIGNNELANLEVVYPEEGELR